MYSPLLVPSFLLNLCHFLGCEYTTCVIVYILAILRVSLCFLACLFVSILPTHCRLHHVPCLTAKYMFQHKSCESPTGFLGGVAQENSDLS